MKSICINCGSNMGFGDRFKSEAIKVGKYLARQNIIIVYGGATVGLMGEVANAALREGGEVIGVIPKSIHEKVGHKGLSRLIVVDNMAERKKMMFELSEGFIAFPGGFGTLEEIAELITWGQLGFHTKPCAFLNVDHYYDKLFDFIENMVQKGFIKREHSDMIIKEKEIEKILEKFKDYQAPTVEKWIR
jgi:uncharacterized protein (TIGR00730 family)